MCRDRAGKLRTGGKSESDNEIAGLSILRPHDGGDTGSESNPPVPGTVPVSDADLVKLLTAWLSIATTTESSFKARTAHAMGTHIVPGTSLSVN